MIKTIHFLVSGKVQGVFFRMETKQQADQQALGGWVRNTSDGRVEGMVTGEATKLSIFRKWLQQGPPLADVNEVEVEEIELQPYENFTIRY